MSLIFAPKIFPKPAPRRLETTDILPRNGAFLTPKRTNRRVVSTLFFVVALSSHSVATSFAVDWNAPSPTPTNESYVESDEISENVKVDGGNVENVGDNNEKEALDVSDAPLAEIDALKEQLARLQKETDAIKSDIQAEKKKKNDPNGPFNLKIGGQFILDSAFISQEEENREALGNAENTYYMRDARFTARGTGYGNLEYACVVAFCEEVKIQDCYLRYKDSPVLGDLTVGHFFVESGMESVTPVFDKSFATLDENALFFRQNRRLGVGSTIFGSDDRTRAFFGVFMAKSVNTSPYYVSDDNPGYILNGRLTGTPIYRETEDGALLEVLHLGGSYYYLDATGGDATLKMRSRGIGWTGATPYFIDGKIALTDKSYSVAQAEAAWFRNGFTAFSDAFCGSVEDGGNAFGATAGGRYFLTPGCSRKYLKESARFGGVSMPKEALFIDSENKTIGENWGAWEILGKWSWTEANNLRDVAGARFGDVDRFVCGVNWFWNEKTYWTFDWERAFVDSEKNGGATDSSVDTFVLQACVKF